jgi:HK97 family phage major capsid protein
MSEDVKQAVSGLMTAFESFKETNDARIKEIETKGAADPITVEKLAKIEETMSGFESMNAKLTQAEAKAKALADQNDATMALVAQIEAKMGRPGFAPGESREVERKAYHSTWARGVVDAHLLGVANLGDDARKAIARANDELKSLAIAPDTAGGYTAPMEFVREIIKGETEISPVRSLVRVRQTASKSLQVPKRTGQFAAVWVAEQGTRSETTGLTYGLEEIPNHEVYALIDISGQLLEDSAFDMEAEIRTESVEQFEVATGAAVVSGSAAGKPEGFMVNSAVATTNSGAATTITADGMMILKHAIKTAYTRNATWVMNRTTIGSVRKLKDGSGAYLWMPGIAMGRPNTIDGDPYVELPDMPLEGAGLKPIAYGDFRRAYTLVDRVTMQLLRDPYTQATSGNIRFIMRRRIGGQVLLAEAIRTMTCSA